MKSRASKLKLVILVMLLCCINAKKLASTVCEIAKITNSKNSVAILVMENDFPPEFIDEIFLCASESSTVILIDFTVPLDRNYFGWVYDDEINETFSKPDLSIHKPDVVIILAIKLDFVSITKY